MEGSEKDKKEIYLQLRPLEIHGSNSFFTVHDRNLEKCCASISKMYSIKNPLTLPVKRFFALLDLVAK